MRYLFIGLTILLFSNFTTCQDSKDGYVSLFDGETLDGWKTSDENPASFYVEDGMLVAKGGRSHLFYQGTVEDHNFRNFELRMSVKTTAKSNSGVYFHTRYQANGWPDTGFEAQVNSNHSDPRKTGSLYGIVNMWSPEKKEEAYAARVDAKGEVFIQRDAAPSKDGEWFDYYIKVEGDHIIIKVDGYTTVDWTQPRSWAKDRRVGRGTIGIQAHDPTCLVYYKDIRIKPIKSNK